MIIAAFNIGILTLIFFIIGMFKPNWALFFLKKPDRFLIIVISTVLFMIVATLYGEGNRQAKLEQKTPEQAIIQNIVPAPVPEVAPVPAVAPVQEATPVPEVAPVQEAAPLPETAPKQEGTPAK